MREIELSALRNKKIETPKWGRTTKLVVLLVCLALAAFLAWQFKELVGQLVVAAMLAYIVNPAIEWFQGRPRFSRGWAVMIVYLLLILIVLGFVTVIGVAVTNQTLAITAQVPAVVKNSVAFFSQIRTSSDALDFAGLHIELATIDWNQVQSQVMNTVTPALSQTVPAVGQSAAVLFGFMGWLSITLLLSIYFAIDLRHMGDQLMGLADQSGYRDDMRRLVRSFNRIWDAYLRGQLIMGIVIAVITSAMLAALGVQNWLVLGLMSGVLQVIPYVGPTVSAALIVLFALFQPSNYMGVTPGIYAIIVGVVTLVVQQVSGNILLPTVVGDALNMSPLAVLVSLIFGFAVGGVMGVILAAPVIASLRLLVSYMWRKLLDLPPFPHEEPPPTQVTMWVRRSREMIEQIRNRGGKIDEPATAETPDMSE